jgi:DNA-binding beta-propeller fold protein YncE
VIAIRPDYKTAVVINGDGNTGFSAGPIVIFDLVSGTVLQQLRPFTGAKVSLTGAIYSPDGQHLYASDYANNATIDAYQVAADGTVTYTGSVNLPTPNGNNSTPAGLAISADGNTIYAALNGINEPEGFLRVSLYFAVFRTTNSSVKPYKDSGVEIIL